MAEVGEISREIRRAVDTGKVVFGFKQAEKILLKGNAELLIFSNNAPKASRERIQEYATIAGIPCYDFEGSSLELGAICGKPFMVSVVAIQDYGKSKIFTAIKTEKKPKIQEWKRKIVKKKKARK